MLVISTLKILTSDFKELGCEVYWGWGWGQGIHEVGMQNSMQQIGTWTF